MNTLCRLLTEESGADATEYALLAGLIAVMLVGVAAPIGMKLGDALGSFGNQVPITVP